MVSRYLGWWLQSASHLDEKIIALSQTPLEAMNIGAAEAQFPGARLQEQPPLKLFLLQFPAPRRPLPSDCRHPRPEWRCCPPCQDRRDQAGGDCPARCKVGITISGLMARIHVSSVPDAKRDMPLFPVQHSDGRQAIRKGGMSPFGLRLFTLSQKKSTGISSAKARMAGIMPKVKSHQQGSCRIQEQSQRRESHLDGRRRSNAPNKARPRRPALPPARPRN